MTRALVALVLVAAAAGPAAATPNLPAALTAHLQAPVEPHCRVCHEGGVTGRGTVTTPFGLAMMARGLVAYDEGSLTTALDRMATDAVDSNHNGVTDIDELKAGTDPNAGAAPADVPVYGCAVSSRAPAGGLVLVLVLVLALARRGWNRGPVPDSVDDRQDGRVTCGHRSGW
ncbi:MAG TPA: hypothetical protein VGQ83_29025 [Polyangia bacterium]|jgi:hypothetical protein